MSEWTADEYLAHHGILGQRWGKKNGPPYPLGSGDHSAEEKKAGWRKSLAEGDRTKDYSRKIKKSLNKLDNKRVELQDKLNVARYRKDREIAKNAGTDNDISKFVDKRDKETEDYNRRLKENKEEAASLIQDALNSGYDINSEIVAKNARIGEDMLRAAGFGLSTSIPLKIIDTNLKGSTGIIEGEKYTKVKKTENNIGEIDVKVSDRHEKAIRKSQDWNAEKRYKSINTVKEKNLEKAGINRSEIDSKLESLDIPKHVLVDVLTLNDNQKNLYYKAETAKTDEEHDDYMRKFDESLLKKKK